MEEKRAQILARMQQRRNELQEKMSKKKQGVEAIKKLPPLVIFHNKFEEDRNKILDLLSRISPTNLSQYTEQINNLVECMRKSLAETSQMLSGYDKRRAMNTLQELLAKIREAILKVDPQASADELKTFKFSESEKLIKADADEALIDSYNNFNGEAGNSKVVESKWWEEDGKTFKVVDLSEKTIEIGPECNGCDISLSRLENCKIHIKGFASTVYATHLNNCTLVTYPVTTSIFVENCDFCTFCVACQQLRLHTCSNCLFYLHVTSRAVMEHSQDLQFSPYALKPTENTSLTDLFANAKLDINLNNWNSINDFDWPLKTKPSPNWTIMDENLRISFNV